MYGIIFPIFVAVALTVASPVGAQTAEPANPARNAASDFKPADAKPVDAVAPPSPSELPPPSAGAPPAPNAANDPGGTKPAETPAAGAPAPASDTPAPQPTAVDAPADPSKGSGSSLIPHDLSPYGMFMNADIVVKAVMVGLAFASLVTWTILLVKVLELFGARSRATTALGDLTQSSTLREAVAGLRKPKSPVGRFATAALAEVERSQGLAAEGIKERAAALLSRIEAHAGRSMGRGTGLLATIGSTAPFVGLFGTVWGIMNSFIGISKTNTTNLAVVAPGIAEALLATAFGLVAAIPAVIIYNMFARGITGYRSVLNDASTEVLRLLSRDLDRDDAAIDHRHVTRQAAE